MHVWLAYASSYTVMVGLSEGLALGEAEGLAVGEADGLALGEAEGLALGLTVGDLVGAVVGARTHSVPFQNGEARGQIQVSHP